MGPKGKFILLKIQIEIDYKRFQFVPKETIMKS
jgi:hypothetical protein